MRLGVVDVGSNTVHLLVVDAHPGARPVPAYSLKTELRLAELSGRDGRIRREGARQLLDTISDAATAARELEVDDLVAFATSALRDAPNGPDVIADVTAVTGVDLTVLEGGDEARLTFLAVRRWFGWSAGRLLVLDIGGGSLEVATGVDEEPDFGASLPLGAGRTTREFLTSDPPKREQLAALRKHAKALVRPVADAVLALDPPDRVVGTSKTFRTLARLTGAAPSSQGPMVERTLSHGQLASLLHRIAKLDAARRATLDGLSASRARQIVGGAVVADVAMEAMGVAAMHVCPWALREGVILRRLDLLAGG